MPMERFGQRDWLAGFRFLLGGQPAMAEAVVPVDDTGAPAGMTAADRAALAAAGKDYYDVVVPFTTNVAQPARRGIYAYVTTAGTAVLTVGGVDITFSFALGPTVLPLAVTKYVAGTAVGSFYSLG